MHINRKRTRSEVRSSCLASIAFLGLVAAAPAQVIYAKPAGTGSGASWADAASLADAIKKATAGDQVWAAAGVHFPGTTRSDSFTIKSGVHVYGGFFGNETTLASRAGLFDTTVLSGDIALTPSDPSDDSYHIVSIKDFGQTTTGVGGNFDSVKIVLDGFSIYSGNADGTGIDGYGGGILLWGRHSGIGGRTYPLQLANVTIRDNLAKRGAGIASYLGIVQMKRCTFRRNDASVDGGAMYLNQSGLTGLAAQRILCYNTLFANNSAQQHGGAVYVMDDTACITQNCAFRDNEAIGGNGGAFYAVDQSLPFLVNTTMVDNSSVSGDGGGIFIESDSFVMIHNSILWGNHADAAGSISSVSGPGTINAIEYSDVEFDGGIVWPGPGNISADPVLNGQLHLTSTSPCINVGLNSHLWEDWLDLDDDSDFAEPTPLDIANSVRIDGSSMIVDMGWHEYLAPAGGSGV